MRPECDYMEYNGRLSIDIDVIGRRTSIAKM